MDAKYNDLEVAYDDASLQFLRDNGLDDALARHVAHQLVRDPLVMYQETMNQGAPRFATILWSQCPV